jgi:hypothetical protein
MNRNPSTANTLLTPQAALSAKARTKLSTVWKMMALAGVLNLGCAFPSHAGRTPTLAIRCRMRVEAFIEETGTAMAEFTTGRHQPAPSARPQTFVNSAMS